MPDVAVERRGAAQYSPVPAAEVIELPRASKLSARPADISRTGCYIDTLNPIPEGSRIRLRLTHHDRALEILGRVRYFGYGLGWV